MGKVYWLCCLLFCSMAAWAQRQVSGQIYDTENKAPLAGVSITVWNSSLGTTTDENGFFRLTVPSNANRTAGELFRVCSREIALTAENNYEIALARSVQSLDEVVVVACGIQEKRKITGSVSKISARQIENIPLASVDQILQGKTPACSR